MTNLLRLTRLFATPSIVPAADTSAVLRSAFVISYLALGIYQCLCGSALVADELKATHIFLGQGTMSGEVTDSTALLQTCTLGKMITRNESRVCQAQSGGVELH